MKTFMAGALAALWLLLAPALDPALADDCGQSAPCSVAEGSYHYKTPGRFEGPAPVILHFHG